MRFSLIPREMRFFDLFDEVAAAVTASGAKLLEMVSAFDNLQVRARAMKTDEEACDKMVSGILDALDRSFITPFDREDIHSLVTSMDDVIDSIEETAHRFFIFRIERPTSEAVELARIVMDSCSHVENAIRLLRDLRQSEQIQVHLREIGRLENQADSTYRQVDAELFAKANGNILELIKWRELYAWLEDTVDATKKVAHVISEIVVKGT